MQFESGKNRVLSVFTLVMINVIAIDSLRNLPANASMGLGIVFFYILAGFLFLLPCVLITAELATHWPKTGGAYVWVKEAFGPRWGFLNIWLQWIYNVIWYPTILSFIAANVAYLINPSLANNKLFLLPMIIGMFTIATLANWFGMKISGLVSSASAILGTIVPMLLIIGLGIAWLYQGKTVAITPTFSHFFPKMSQVHNLAFLVVVFFSLMGLEMSAVHAEEVKNPVRDYPRALIYSSLIIIATLILASCAIAIIVPQTDLNIVSGLDQAYALFLNALHLKWLLPIIVVLIILGAFGGMAAWVIGPTKGLLVAAEDKCAPKVFAKHSKKNVPTTILILQWVVVVALCCLFLFFKYISTWYWILSDLTSQLALMFYIVLFAAAIRLRYKTPENSNAFRIPGGKFGIWLVGSIGILSCVTAIIIGLIPPDNIKIGSVALYETILIGGILLLTIIPLWISRQRGTSRET
ncbi:MAG: amino acid permease [Coxiellaceae bacterium]|nr:amino acid permease [Coxiellaceae bacterium]